MLQLPRVCIVLCLILICGAVCRASDLVFIRGTDSLAAEQAQLVIASSFYGLDLKVVTVRPGEDVSLLPIIRKRTTLAVAIDSQALGSINQRPFLRSLESQIPLLVLGITRNNIAGILKRWSGGGLQGVERLSKDTGLEYIVGRAPNITGELSDVSLPYRGESPYVLAVNENTSVRKILAVRTGRGDLPVFVEATTGGHPIFFASAWTFQRRQHRTMPGPDIVDAFTAVAPAMLFVKYAAGVHGWHTPAHYANLTIDDPWLREPYGHLDYAKLLAEMREHNFHTSIAFIPWNYKRSTSEVVSLFRNNPDRYSIAVHGDNHDHKEFDTFRDSPLNVQAFKLRQALARMDAFQQLTGIPFDRVFVFPHSIGEGPILRELKRYNYVATVNSTNVPLGCSRPTEPVFDLRPVTTAFYGFPSILRYPAAIQVEPSLIAVNEYLGNPLFFYAHQDFFSAGIRAFDSIADQVNTREPGTEWRSLGFIASHLFLIRQSGDSRYDIFSFSSTIDLDNLSTRPVRYDVAAPEPMPTLIQSVTVNGRSISSVAKDGLLTFSIAVPPGGKAHTAVIYATGNASEHVSIAHRSIRVYLLRVASDFRDIWFSRVSFGEAITAYYYEHNGTPSHIVAFVAIVVLSAAGALWYLIGIVRRRKLGTRSPTETL